MFSKGDVEHGDSMGNKGVICSGDIQWMTAGSGIIHQEMPKGNSNGEMYGFQLWANLPKNHKMMDPRYQEVKSNQFPTVTRENGTKIKVVAGEVEGAKGPVRTSSSTPEYVDVTVPAIDVFDLPTRRVTRSCLRHRRGRAPSRKRTNCSHTKREAADYFESDEIR